MLAAIGLLGGFGLTGCGERLPTYRYRLTVEVEAPEGLRTGSSVIEVRTHEGAAFPGPEAASIRSDIRGEAVAVDLGERGTLFALLRSSDGQTGAGGYAWALLPNRPTGGEDVEARRVNYEALRTVAGRAELPRQLMPMLVRFRDIADPRSVEAVDPGDLASAFGRGVQLRRITVEITDDAVTEGIVRRLPWWEAYADKQLDGDRLVRSSSLGNNLNALAFKQGG
jgi:hypothetical protein